MAADNNSYKKTYDAVDLYNEFSQPIYRYLMRLSGSEQCAKDLTQETFYQALKSINRLQDTRHWFNENVILDLNTGTPLNLISGGSNSSTPAKHWNLTVKHVVQVIPGISKSISVKEEGSK